ncbi:hypothetical protein A7D17_02025 [Xanthomonas floridensis]|uniref:Uncharacterized protein n=1 Tax=Xanthomonas floridensis TaxID=1843580 RepID=A0A1A9MD44_9XANT|nr:hypothetical protein A7D17_02025 [Xanthomonas floridensis]
MSGRSNKPQAPITAASVRHPYAMATCDAHLLQHPIRPGVDGHNALKRQAAPWRCAAVLA